jgi:hypothetical protein
VHFIRCIPSGYGVGAFSSRLSSSSGDYGPNLDDVIGFQHCILRNELVTTDDHGGAREKAEMLEYIARAPAPAQLELFALR